MKAHLQPGESAVDHTQEWLARFGNPVSTQIDGWLPIHTAPLDGTTVFVRDGKWEPCHARFADGCWRFVEYVSFVPTLWQPPDTYREKAGEK